MNNNLKSFVIGAFLTVFIVGVIFAVWKMSQPGPISPTVPQIKPQASETTTTAACNLAFTVAEIPVLKCDSVKIDPTDTNVVPSDKRTLIVSGSGGTGTLKYTWTTTGGSLSATTGSTITWTAPSNLNKTQSWTITATVTDEAGKTATSDSCKTTLNYTFNSSCNSTCQSSADCPNDLACSTGRCRNPSCVDQTGCKCPPPPKVCNETCTVNSECMSGFICAGGNCRNPSCITQPSCTCPPPVSYVPPTPTPTPAPAPAPIVYTHKTCQNNACVTVNGRANDTCTSDVSCQPKATPPPIPKSGVELPTILTILGGVAMLAIGLIAL